MGGKEAGLPVSIDKNCTALFRRHVEEIEYIVQRTKESISMAKNTGTGHRKGAVTGRTQFQRPDGNWQKRDERTGQLMEVKDDGKPFKGIAKEPDGRDTENS